MSPRAYVPVVLCSVTLAACGGSSAQEPAASKPATPKLEGYEMNGLRGDAFTVSVNVQKACIQGQIGTIEAGDAADKLADINSKLPGDAAIRKAIREVATTMRGCGATDQADRLNALTD